MSLRHIINLSFSGILVLLCSLSSLMVDSCTKYLCFLIESGWQITCKLVFGYNLGGNWLRSECVSVLQNDTGNLRWCFLWVVTESYRWWTIFKHVNWSSVWGFWWPGKSTISPGLLIEKLMKLGIVLYKTGKWMIFLFLSLFIFWNLLNEMYNIVAWDFL